MNLPSVVAMHCSSSSSSPVPLSLFSSKKPRLRHSFSLLRKQRIRVACSRLSVEEISQVFHNKVLVAATFATAIGQISKPFTSAINGKGFDLRNAIRSGGMPSTHSASVVAVSTSLGLERGFSDAIFGMTVVFAAIVMYDAQGVRKEVGNHAKVLNKLTTQEENSPNSETRMPSINSDKISNLYPSNDETKYSNIVVNTLNESVGHTRVQVFVGALLGFLISLIVDVAF